MATAKNAFRHKNPSLGPGRLGEAALPQLAENYFVNWSSDIGRGVPALLTNQCKNLGTSRPHPVHVYALLWTEPPHPSGPFMKGGIDSKCAEINDITYYCLNIYNPW